MGHPGTPSVVCGGERRRRRLEDRGAGLRGAWGGWRAPGLDPTARRHRWELHSRPPEQGCREALRLAAALGTEQAVPAEEPPPGPGSSGCSGGHTACGDTGAGQRQPLRSAPWALLSPRPVRSVRVPRASLHGLTHVCTRPHTWVPTGLAAFVEDVPGGRQRGDAGSLFLGGETCAPC